MTEHIVAFGCRPVKLVDEHPLAELLKICPRPNLKGAWVTEKARNIMFGLFKVSGLNVCLKAVQQTLTIHRTAQMPTLNGSPVEMCKIELHSVSDIPLQVIPIPPPSLDVSIVDTRRHAICLRTSLAN